MTKKAQWIWGADIPHNHAPNTWMAFRKTIHIAQPGQISAQIATDSKYWLYINGELVVFEGGLKRGPTRHDTYVDTVDISAYLRQGENTIAVLVVFFGVRTFQSGDRTPLSYSDISSGKGGLFFEAEDDGVKIISDSSWKVKRHGGYIQPVTSPNYRLPETDINYDATRAIDMEGWHDTNYDDSFWDNATEMGAPPMSPWNMLYPRPIPLWKDSGTILAEPFRDGNRHIIKLPRNLHTTAYIKIDAPEAGMIIKISTNNSDQVDAGRAQYITKAGVQEYESLLWLSGWEIYVDIPHDVNLLALGYRATGYDTEFVGSFNCDDEWLNEMWIKSRDTLYVTMRDNFMDCPDRERAAWWGDAVTESLMAYYALDEKAHALTVKGLLNAKAWSKDGVRVTVPVCGEWFELPCQSLASIVGDWVHYVYTGDITVLNEMYQLNCDYLLNHFTMNAQCVVNHRTGSWDWGDWGANVDILLLTNVWYYMALSRMLDALALLGIHYRTNELTVRCNSISTNFNRVFWNETAYMSPDVQIPDDRGNALAVCARLATAEKFPLLRKVLADRQFASPYMEKYVLEALCIMSFPQDAIARMKVKYAPMFKTGSPTLWEYFPAGGTANHAWSGGALVILSKYLAGISPTQAGLTAFSVKPQMAGLKRIDAVVPTANGNILVNLTQNESNIDLNITVPTGTMATIELPKKGGGIASFEAKAGKWHFSSK